jgi:hypothetical protein
MLPEPLAVQVAPPVAEQVQATEVRSAEKVSVATALVATSGPTRSIPIV